QRRDPRGRVLDDIRPGDGRGLESADTEQLGVDGSGVPWLAGAQGLLRWDGASGRFVHPPGAPRTRVHAFAFVPGDAAPADALWTQSTGGLLRFRIGADGALLQDHRAGLDDGLPAIGAGGMAVDARGEVWMTTARGLYRYRPQT